MQELLLHSLHLPMDCVELKFKLLCVVSCIVFSTIWGLVELLGDTMVELAEFD